MSANKLLTRLGGLMALFLLFVANPSGAAAADLKLEVKLIWGTKDDKSPNPDHKPVESALAKKLRKVFVWPNYFEVNRQTVIVPIDQTKTVKLSSKCTVELKNLGNSRVEVKLIGNGKLVSKNAQTLTPGEDLIVAGDDKNDSAWFVVIRSVDSR